MEKRYLFEDGDIREFEAEANPYPAELEGLHRLDESLPRFTEDTASRHPAVIEENLGRG